MEIGKRNLRLLNILTFLDSFRTFDAVLAIYFVEVTGSYASAMVALSMVNLSSAFFEVPTGLFSDRIGRKKTLMMHYAFGAIALTLYFLADSFWMLILGTISVGFSTAMSSGAVQAFVYENLESMGEVDGFKKYEGRRRSSEKYALFFAALVGTIIIKYFNIRAALLVPILFRLIAFLASSKLHNIDISHKMSGNIYSQISVAWKQFVSNITLKNIGIAQIISQGGGNLEYRFRALYFKTLVPDWVVSLISILSTLISAFIVKSTHRIVDKLGYIRVLVFGETINRIVTMLVVVSNTYIAPFFLGLVGTNLFGLKNVISEDILQDNYSSQQRATMGSLIGLGSNLFYSILGVGVGYAADIIGVKNTLLVLQPLLFISVIYYWIGIKHHLRKT